MKEEGLRRRKRAAGGTTGKVCLHILLASGRADADKSAWPENGRFFIDSHGTFF